MKMGRLTDVITGVAVFLGSMAVTQAQTAGTSSETERIERLETAVRQLQVEKEALQREVSALKQISPAQMGSETNAATAPSCWKTNILNFVLPAGKESFLKLGGYLQGQGEFGDVGSFSGNFSDNPTGAAGHSPLHQRFRLRRARLNITGDFVEKFDFKAEGDFTQSDGTSGNRTAFSGTDIFVNWHQFAEANLKFGQYKAPFGIEQTTPDTTLFTAERSLATGGLTPERQVGLQISGKPLTELFPKHKELIDYSAGIFNGNGRNVTINDDASFMYVGRVGVTPFTGEFHGQPVALRLGADAMTSRYATGTRISPGDNLLMSQIDGSLSAFTAPSAAESDGWDLNETLTVGPFDLTAEYLEQNIRPQNSTSFTEFVANGYYIQGGYFLPGRKVQLVAKWVGFNPGQAAEDDVNSMLGGINYYIRGDNLKLMLNYVHTWSEFRENHPGTGEAEFDEVLLRLQLMF